MSSRRRSVPMRLVSEFRRRLAVARGLLSAGPPTSARRRGPRELEELRAAEARLDAGSFGMCEACSRPIAVRRLRAEPTTRLCARCVASRTKPR